MDENGQMMSFWDYIVTKMSYLEEKIKLKKKKNPLYAVVSISIIIKKKPFFLCSFLFNQSIPTNPMKNHSFFGTPVSRDIKSLIITSFTY
jgi:hypothetical protein